MADTSAKRAAVDDRWSTPGGLGDQLDAAIADLGGQNPTAADAVATLRDDLDAQVASAGNGGALDADRRQVRRDIEGADDLDLRLRMDRVTQGREDEADRALILAEYARRGLDAHGFARVHEGDGPAMADRLAEAATSAADDALARSGDYPAIRARLVALGVTIYPAEPGADQMTLPGVKRRPVGGLERKVLVRVGSASYEWDPHRHPRDRHGKFITAGGEVRTLAGDIAKVTGIVDANHVEVQHPDGHSETLDRHDVTVTKSPGGLVPTARVEHVATPSGPVTARPTDRSMVQHQDGWTGTVTGGQGADLHVQRHDTGQTHTVPAAQVQHLGHEVSDRTPPAPPVATSPAAPAATAAGHDARQASPPGEDVATLDDYSLIHGLNSAPTPDVQQRLAAELRDRAAKQASALLARVTPTEAHTTPLLHSLADDLGMKMRGLGEVHDPSGEADVDARFKTLKSLTRKINDKSIERNKPTDATAGRIGDALRYTMTADTANYAAHTQAVLDRLKAEGYTVKEADNSWGQGNSYRGVNTAIVAPDGTEFELQFHTPESFTLKDGALHEHYEAMRDPAKPYAERLAAYQACVQLSDALPDPPGVESVGDLKTYGAPEAPAAPKTPKTPKALDVPSTDFGMTYDPADADKPSVLVGKTWGGWDDLPTTDVNLTDTPLHATEETLASSSINKVVSGGEPLREGYDPHILIDRSGVGYVIDGHHRVAMYGGLHRDTMPAKVYDERTMPPIGRLADVPPEVSQALAGIKATGRPDGAGTVEDPIAVGDDLDRAVALLAEGKHVRLDQPEQVATLVDRLAAETDRLEKAGQDAPDFDLCLVSVPGTNLFCADHRGVDRIAMPQFSGQAVPGSPAAAIANSKGKADVSAAFREELRRQGISVTDRTMPASHLRATQRQLNGAKIGGMVAALRAGDLPPGSIFVTREGYVIDGHHRWAANVTADVADNRLGDSDMPVEVVDLDIGTALDMANEFTHRMGIAAKGLDEGFPGGAPPGGAIPLPTGDEPVNPASVDRAVSILGAARVAEILDGAGLTSATDTQLRALITQANNAQA